MWAYLVIGVCAFSCLQSAIAVVALFRFLPSLLSLLRYLVRLLFVCSFRLYRLILTWIAPLARRYLNLNVLDGVPRLIASSLLSITFSCLGLWLLSIDIAWWNMTLTVLHGLIVGLLWEDISHPGDLQMGIKLQ
jgi:hypothetical protein